MSKHFICTCSLSLTIALWNIIMLLLFPFYRWGYQVLDKWSYLPQVTHLVSNGAGIHLLRVNGWTPDSIITYFQMPLSKFRIAVTVMNSCERSMWSLWTVLNFKRHFLGVRMCFTCLCTQHLWVACHLIPATMIFDIFGCISWDR